MDFTSTSIIAKALIKDLKINIDSINEDSLQAQIGIESQDLIVVCKYLYENSKYFFDFLNCISAVDNGVEIGTIDILYHLSSIPFGHVVVLKVQINREIGTEIDSVSGIWKSADWHEREIFDFFGIKFKNHPDLRRILLPSDWEGFPLRKDYQEQETYHGIKVKYQND